jgi:dTDP-4-dehydrorhamnose 3,5-epimerase-like enzyme
MNFQIISFQIHGDKRGSLISLEQDKNIPFAIKRVYYIFGTKADVRRGFHSHKNLKQILICVSGGCKILLDDGKERKIIDLNSPQKGLLINKNIWHEMYDFSDDCVLMVLANGIYEESDYIRDYHQFLESIK